MIRGTRSGGHEQSGSTRSRFASKPAQLLFNVSHLVERYCALIQGKGYGTASIRQEVALVRRLLDRQPALVIDIGGNIGDYTAELLRGTPALEAHLFEPAPSNVDKLRARFSELPHVKIVPVAVSNVDGLATLYSNRPGSGLASLTKRNLAHFDIAFDHSDAVTVVRFEDYWVQQLNRRSIDIVKLDVEGHELAALNGFGEAIHAVSVIQFEFGGCNIDSRTFFQDFWYFFHQANFDLYRITPIGLEPLQRYRERDETFLVSNFVAANRQPA